MIEVVLSNGDRAEAETPGGAVLAARTLMREALETKTHGHYLAATFYVDGRRVANTRQDGMEIVLYPDSRKD